MLSPVCFAVHAPRASLTDLPSQEAGQLSAPRSVASRGAPSTAVRAEAFWNSLSHGCVNCDSLVNSSVPSQDAGWSPRHYGECRGAHWSRRGSPERQYFRYSFFLRLGRYLAPPVISAKLKGITMDGRDFSLVKGYSAVGNNKPDRLRLQLRCPHYGVQQTRPQVINHFGDEVMKVFKV